MFDPNAAPKAKGAKKGDYHVVAAKKGGWDVIREGGVKASAHFQLKADAVAKGKELAKKQKVNLVQHDKKGNVHKRDQCEQLAF